MIDKRLIDAAQVTNFPSADIQKTALARGLAGNIVKLANLGRVNTGIQSGLSPADAVRKAYPNYNSSQVSSYLQMMKGKSKQASAEDLEKIAVLGLGRLAPWLARQSLLRGGGRSAKAGERYLLRRSAREGRLENLAQRRAAEEAGKGAKYTERSARKAGRKPVMDTKREIGGLQQQAAQRFSEPSAMEKLRFRMGPMGGMPSQSYDAMRSIAGIGKGQHGGAGLGARDIVGRYLKAGAGRRGMIAGGMDLATLLGQGGARLGKSISGGARNIVPRVLQGPKRPELLGARMYAGNREAQLQRGLLASILGGGGATMI